MDKYSFKFRLDKQNSGNEFLNDNIVFIDMKDVTLPKMVKLINLSLNIPTKIKKPEFEVFGPNRSKE